MTFASLTARPTAFFNGLVDGLLDNQRRQGIVLRFVVGYALLWWLYAIAAKSSQSMNADLAEMAIWGQQFAYGYPKHPPLLGWVIGAWFMVFPRADWAFELLAAINLALGLWIAYLLAGEWLDGLKRIAVPFLLAVIPFNNFLGLKFDQNSALIPLWGLTALALVRSLDTRSLGWAVVAGIGASCAMLTKYWSAFFLLGLIVAVLADRERNAYFRSAAPYVTTVVAALPFLPHVAWLIQNDFPPMRWVGDRRKAQTLFDWFRSLSEYSFGTLGYASIALIAYFGATRPSLAALRDVLLPRDNARRRVALMFWVPLLAPIAVAAATGVNLLSLWNTSALTLLPVVLLSSPKVTLTREMTARIVATGTTVSVVACLVSPLIAFVLLKTGVENDAPYARVVMTELDRQWQEKIGKPLTLVAGPFGLATSATFYGKDRPANFADFNRYLSPWATPERIRREGMAIACPTDDEGCLDNMRTAIAAAPGATRTEVELRLRWLGLASAPRRFVIALLPPAA